MKTAKLVSLVGSAALALVLSVPLVSAQDTQVIKIASQSPLSGPASNIGGGIRNGVELAIQQNSEALEELGFTIEFVPYDDQATPEVGVGNAQAIVADPAILGLVGHYNSGVAIPSSEVYDANNLVMVSPANTNPTVTDRALLTVNRICGRDDLQGPTGAVFAAEELGVTSVYILNDATTYGAGLADFFQQKAEELGLEILGYESTEETANFDGVIQPILALQPDLVYFGGLYPVIGVFVSQARAAGYTGMFMSGDGLDSPEFAELAGEAGVGTYFTTVAGPASVFPNAAQFVEDYTEAYDEVPTPFAAQSYDSTVIILKGIEAAAIEAGGLPTREAVAAAVRATENYEGLTGAITFDDNGDPEVGLYFVVRVDTADPEEWANNEIVSTVELPSPLMAAAEAEGS